jgi:hypothetical protein
MFAMPASKIFSARPTASPRGGGDLFRRLACVPQPCRLVDHGGDRGQNGGGDRPRRNGSQMHGYPVEQDRRQVLPKIGQELLYRLLGVRPPDLASPRLIKYPMVSKTI